MQTIRVLLAENGSDLTHVATPEKPMPAVERLDKMKARQIIKARSAMITDIANQAKSVALSQLDEISRAAQQGFAEHLDKEIGRLKRLQAINPNVRDDEIQALMTMKQEGLSALEMLSLVPDSIRVLVCVKPE